MIVSPFYITITFLNILQLQSMNNVINPLMHPNIADNLKNRNRVNSFEFFIYLLICWRLRIHLCALFPKLNAVTNLYMYVFLISMCDSVILR